MDFIYPTFYFHSDRGILPSIYLPRNFKELFACFDEKGGRKDIEQYVDLEKIKPLPLGSGLCFAQSHFF